MADYMGKWFQDKSENIHAWANGKGWWDEPREPAVLIELIHSEISEATEEIRANKPAIYQIHKTNEPILFGEKLWSKDCKPEGHLIELADAAIRALDTLCFLGINIENRWEGGLAAVVIGRYPNELFFHMILRKTLNNALVGSGIFSTALVEFLALLVKYFRMHRLIDIREVIDMKMEYNQTRPYRHGGKKY
jgi:hypothetical protein